MFNVFISIAIPPIVFMFLYLMAETIKSENMYNYPIKVIVKVAITWAFLSLVIYGLIR